MPENKTLGWLAVMTLVLATFVVVAAPTATAHECKAYDGCDAGGCKEGEDHEHTDYNYVERDEYCKSSSTPPPEPCIIADREFPPAICAIIDPESLIPTWGA